MSVNNNINVYVVCPESPYGDATIDTYTLGEFIKELNSTTFSDNFYEFFLDKQKAFRRFHTHEDVNSNFEKA
jgi:hypothetical protein|tara:strand:+ start:135 stop:350 length:216 start_codon:yes stop_codon:yes gene_type:complete